MNNLSEGKHINESQITFIKTFLKLKYDWYYHVKEIKFFGFTIRKEGFRSNFGSFQSKEYFNSGNTYVENNTIYYKPLVEIYTSDGKVHTKYFEDEHYLQLFISKIKANIKTIKL